MVVPSKRTPAAARLLTILLIFSLAFAETLVPACAAAAETQPPPAELCLLSGLEQALAQHRKIAARGGWPVVPPGPILHEGFRGEGIRTLKLRLAVSDDLPGPAATGDQFDASLTQAVRRFQARHGLKPDGVVGPRTLVEINVPVIERIRQIRASLERCQPLPQVLGERHILINIADFSLKLYEEGQIRLSMPVIVGRTFRQTPVFNSKITALVLNPSWEVPESIATKDLLPKIQKDPAYLKKSHLRVLKDWNSDQELDPAKIKWSAISPSRFPYRLRQDPGPDNSLGRIKFILPNPYDVYLHDTPTRELFKKSSRTFSSGCIRLADPLGLALYLLQGTSLSTMAQLVAAIGTQQTRQINVPKPIDVHIVYMTAWVDPDGVIQFRPDIYRRN